MLIQGNFDALVSNETDETIYPKGGYSCTNTVTEEFVPLFDYTVRDCRSALLVSLNAMPGK